MDQITQNLMDEIVNIHRRLDAIERRLFREEPQAYSHLMMTYNPNLPQGCIPIETGDYD